MRTLTILRALTLAAVLSAPLAQVALANQQQQALVNQNAAPASNTATGIYDGPAFSSSAGN
ncbi:MAG: hypothetical protein WCF13_00265 [Stellaceae bacterium]